MNKTEKKYWRRVSIFLKVLKFVPFLRSVSVCNSLAFGFVDEESDIDLFIVAKEGHLFFVRFVVTFFLQILGVRRHGKKIAGRFCLSFFIDDSVLDFKSLAIEDDIYLAFWLFTLVPVFDDGFLSDFLDLNSWIFKFLDVDRYDNKVPLIYSDLGYFARMVEFFCRGDFGKFVEKKLMVWQLSRAKNKMENLKDASGTIITSHILKFHNSDRRRYFSRLWVENYSARPITLKEFIGFFVL